MPTQYTKKARPIGWTIDMWVLTTSGCRAETVSPTKSAPAAPKRSGPILMAPIAAPNATTTNSASRGEDAKREAIAFRVPVASLAFFTTVILPALRTSRIGYTGARN